MIRVPRSLPGAAITAAALALGLGSVARAQDAAGTGGQAARPGTPADANFVLVFPTGDRATGHLLVEMAGPAEVPVGREYGYQIRATNISKNLVLEDVRLRQTQADGFSIEKSDPKAEDDKQGDKGGAEWKIARLGPGESRLIKVTAMADKEGETACCLQATFQPSLCLTTRFVKPAIQVSKQSPERSDLCDILTYRYTVTNTGSGAARELKLRDELADGLTTTDGRKALEFDVGELAPGQSREFTAKVQADRPGDYGSRAVAQGANDLKAQSSKPTTAIRQAKLQVTINGPDAIYVRQPMTYRATVKNEGEAPARDARLRIDVDRRAKLIRMSKSEPRDAEPGLDGNALHWDLGTIEPGREVDVSFTIVGHEEAEFKHTATASSACSRGGDLAQAASSTATAQTRILTFPALLLELVDRTDPVRVGDTETYRVTVLNQGSGADHDVKISLKVPEQFEFAGASGPGESKADGRTITLGPIDRLQPRARAGWDVRLKANRPGDVRMQATLTSRYLTEERPAISIEPTRIIGSEVREGEKTSDSRPRGEEHQASRKDGDAKPE